MTDPRISAFTNNDMNTSSVLEPSRAEEKEDPLIGHQQTVQDCVAAALENYFMHLDGQPATDLYDLVISEAEAPLFEAVLKYTKGNQTNASRVLGINRGTLRKKLKQYGLIG